MKKLLCLFMAFIFVLSGCGTPQSSRPESSSAQSETASESQPRQDDLTVYAGEGFILYRDKSNADIEYENGTAAEYEFTANYKSGGYRVELYYENNSVSGGHMLVHMDGDKITDVMFFNTENMHDIFGRWDVSARVNEKLTIGSLYSQYGGITLNYDFMSHTVTVDRQEIADMGEGWDPRATRQDGLYTIYSHYPSAALDESSTWIRDNTTGDMTKLSDGTTDRTGFMDDGNLYMMDSYDYKEMAVDGSLLYALSDNFPTGRVDKDKGVCRDIRGVYKDVNHSRYYVVYYDYYQWEYVPGTTLLQSTYRLAVLDENGVAEQIIETGKYAETSKNHAVELTVRSVNEYTISFYVETYNTLWFEVFVDLNTEKVTLLDYRQWE